MSYTENYTRFYNYLLHEKRRSINTVTAYKNDLEQFSSFLSSIKTTDLDCSYKDLREWVILLDKDYEKKSILRKIATIKSYFKFLFIRDIRGSNPAAKLKNPKIAKRLPSVITEVKLTELLDHKKWSNENFAESRDKMILDLLYCTGIRRDELIEIKETDINFNRKLISVTGKGNKERLVPFTTSTKIELCSYLEKKHSNFQNFSQHLIVTDKGKKSYPNLIYRTVKKLLAEVTTQKARSPHVLRHSYATHLLDRGADLNAIKELLGHSSLAATQVYTHNSLEKLKESFSLAHPKA